MMDAHTGQASDLKGEVSFEAEESKFSLDCFCE
jgi:hypothetical protein